jgi:hypothetical protein
MSAQNRPGHNGPAPSHCCHGCNHCHAPAPAPEPFRFSDVPPGQWLVGSIMILVVVIGIAIRMS